MDKRSILDQALTALVQSGHLGIMVVLVILGIIALSSATIYLFFALRKADAELQSEKDARIEDRKKLFDTFNKERLRIEKERKEERERFNNEIERLNKKWEEKVEESNQITYENVQFIDHLSAILTEQTETIAKLSEALSARDCLLWGVNKEDGG